MNKIHVLFNNKSYSEQIRRMNRASFNESCNTNNNIKKEEKKSNL